MQRMIVVFLGGPGAGKGTQAQALMHYLPVPRISTGDLLRNEVKRDTELGRKIGKQLSSGFLVHDELVNKVLGNRINSPDCHYGFMLDGYPRTLEQAVALQSQLRTEDKIVVIEINVDTEMMIQRMMSRLTCTSCGRVYNAASVPPQIAGTCDACRAPLARRADDQETVIRNRFRTFYAETLPVRDYFWQFGVYNHVDGMRSPEEVALDILTILDIEGFPLNAPVTRRT